VTDPRKELPPPGRKRGQSRKVTFTGWAGTTEGSSIAEREAALRVHAVAVVLDAVDRGDWETSGDIIDASIALLEIASRWQLVAELESAA
jgi:hypothetical protein